MWPQSSAGRIGPRSLRLFGLVRILEKMDVDGANAVLAEDRRIGGR